MRPADLVPRPRSLSETEGSFDFARGLRISAPREWEGAAGVLRAWLARATGVEAGLESGGSGESPGRKEPELPRISLEADPGLDGSEDYRLEVGPAGVRLRAGSREGALRGASTLWQLALSHGTSLPAFRIEDGPRFSWRGAMLDSVRHFQTPEFIEKFLDLMALHKLNRFHWHLTDDQGWRLDIPSMPEIAREGSRRPDRRVNIPRWYQGSYDREAVRRIVGYAGERGIIVVPEIETPGHVTALLASHPELSCRGGAGDGNSHFLPEHRHGIFEDVLCAGNEAVFELLGRVFDEVALLFPGPWVHAGGDEVPKARWTQCPRCRSLMKLNNLRDTGGALEPELLQGWFMNRVAALLAERGKRMVGWDEILEGRPRKDAIVASWRGYSGGIEAAREGHEVVMSPQTKACYLDHKHLDLAEEPGQLGVCSVRDSYFFEPVPPELGPDEGARILGGQANIWTELMPFGRHIEYMAFPRLSALSEVFWSPKEGRSWEDFRRRLPTHGLRLDALDVNRYRGPLE